MVKCGSFITRAKLLLRSEKDAMRVISVAAVSCYAFNWLYIVYYATNILVKTLQNRDSKHSTYDQLLKNGRLIIVALILVHIFVKRKKWKQLCLMYLQGEIKGPGSFGDALPEWKRKAVVVLMAIFVVVLSFDFFRARYFTSSFETSVLYVSDLLYGQNLSLNYAGYQTVAYAEAIVHSGFSFSYVTPMFFLILLVHDVTLRLDAFIQRIRDLTVLHSSILRDLQLSFRNIVEVIERVNGSFNVLVFLWYTDALAAAVKGIMTIIEISSQFGLVGGVSQSVRQILPSVLILGLTLKASAITSRMERAERELLDARLKVRSVNLSLIFEYDTLASHLKSNVGITVAGCYVLRRSFCVTYIGILLSYTMFLCSSLRLAIRD